MQKSHEKKKPRKSKNYKKFRDDNLKILRIICSNGDDVRNMVLVKESTKRDPFLANGLVLGYL